MSDIVERIKAVLRWVETGEGLPPENWEGNAIPMLEEAANEIVKLRGFDASGDKILACPFCGRLPTKKRLVGPHGVGWSIRCSCDANPRIYEPDEQDAHDAWNMRSPPLSSNDSNSPSHLHEDRKSGA